mgnify:CR=1 FL=1
MKKFRFLSSIIVLLLLITIFPINTYALNKQTSYISINNREYLGVGELDIYDIAFNDYSTTSTRAFGLTGLIKNSSNNNVNYVATAYYYDRNYNLIAKSNNQSIAPATTSNFNLMSNLSILNGHSVSEIAYYQLEVNTDNNNYTSDMLIPSKISDYSYYDYVLDKYDVNIKVNEDNTFDIVETITAYFNKPKHGIFRTIPLTSKITRLDGSKSTNRAKITNLSVNSKYTTSRENGNYKIRIGDYNKTLTGEQTYVIKYKYDLGKDRIKDYDELYYNIIGSEWDTAIGNITFTITMPKNFDTSKLGFSSGSTGSTDNSNIQYNVSNNVITGKYTSILEENEALTVRCELDEGYFSKAKDTIEPVLYIEFIIPLVFLLISFYLWCKFGKDDELIETVEFYPPEGFNSLEIGFLYKGNADNKDVTSLLIYLANKGYIKITESQRKSLFFKYKDFKITKLKEYDGDNINEELFLKGLFLKKSSTISLFSNKYETSDEDTLNEVTSTDLYDSFYITMGKILSNMNNKENKYKIYEKSASNKKIFIILMMIATYLLITIPPIVLFGQIETIPFAIIFPAIGFTVLFTLMFGKTGSVTFINGSVIKSATNIYIKIFGLIWGLGFGGGPWIALVLPLLLQDTNYLVVYIIGLICILGMFLCLKYLPKRTKYGNEILGKIRGFKNFLETVEKDKLEALVEKNPTYFYDILPYTYVLGISDKWIKKFESISIMAPTWYDGNSDFNLNSFSSFINDTMSSAESSMSSSPSSSSGGSSGGGSSGGGSGGGGGGSW